MAAGTSNPFSVSVAPSSLPSPTIIVREDGTGDFTTVQGGINAAGPGDIVEVQANTAGTTQYFEGTAAPTVSGTDGNEITLRGRPGDTIVVYNLGGFCLSLDGVAYWRFSNLRLGRDQTLNGWDYNGILTGGQAHYNANVEHTRSLDARNTAHHITLTDCTLYGGSFYDGALVNPTCSHFLFDRCSFLYAGINKIDGNANAMTFRGRNSILRDSHVQYSGHGNLHLESPYIVVRGGVHDGSWTAFDSTNPGRGTRAISMEGSKGTAPYGPNLVEKCVFKNSDRLVDGDGQAIAKAYAYRVIWRRNVMFDGGDETEAFKLAFLRPEGAAAGDEWHHYHNTVYACPMVSTSTDINTLTGANDHYVDAVFKNNICAEIGSGDANGRNIIWARNNSTKRTTDTDDWRGARFDSNVFSMAAGQTFTVRLNGDGAGTATTVSGAETRWPNTFTNNLDTAPTFPNIANRTSSSYGTAFGAFALGAGSAGENANSPLTQTVGASIGDTALFVEDSKYFYAGGDPATWDLGYFGEVGDYLKIVPAGQDPEQDGVVVQVSTINYDTNLITLTTPARWSSGDDIYLVDTDGSTVINDLGAQP